MGLSTPAVTGGSDDAVDLFVPSTDRPEDAFRRRVEAAKDILEAEIQHTGEYARLEDRIGTHSKGLEHTDTGIVTDRSFNSLENAFKKATAEAFKSVILGGSRELTTPQTALSYNSLGADTFTVPIDKPPAFESKAAGAAMVELYWQALARDVPFVEYDDSPIIEAASEELSTLDGFDGPTDPTVLFRGEIPGSQQGPYLSQFLYRSANYGAIEVTPTLVPFEAGVDYITTFEQWLGISRNGDMEPPAGQFADSKRYITTGRDLFTLVNSNPPGQAFFHAALVAVNEEIPRDEQYPFQESAVQAGFIEAGFPATVLRPIQDIAHQVLRPTWFQKWLGYRYARPEEYGGIVDLTKSDRGKDYSEVLPTNLLEADVLDRTVDTQGNYLLTSGAPEGCPTHPSYPARHAAVAGACGTVLKAIFDEDARIDDPVRANAEGELEAVDADSFRFGDEVNKLMTNNTLGRDFGGFHYRFNGIPGIKLGEAYAITYLEDYISEFAPEPLGPLTFTSVNGDQIKITPSVS